MVRLKSCQQAKYHLTEIAVPLHLTTESIARTPAASWAQGELVRNAESQPPPHPPSSLHSLPGNLHSNWIPLILMYIKAGQRMLFNVKYINIDCLLLKGLQISLDTYFKMFSQITLISTKMLQHLIMVNDLMQRNIMQRVCPLSHKKCPCPDLPSNLKSTSLRVGANWISPQRFNMQFWTTVSECTSYSTYLLQSSLDRKFEWLKKDTF